MLACHAGGPGSIPGRCNLFDFPYVKKVLQMFLSVTVLFFMFQVMRTASNDIAKTSYLPDLGIFEIKLQEISLPAAYIFVELVVVCLAALVSAVLLYFHHHYTVRYSPFASTNLRYINLVVGKELS